MVDSLGGEKELRGDLGVGVPGADQVENLVLAPGQPERVRTRGSPRSSGDRPDAELAHLLPGDPGGSGGAEIGEDPQGLTQRCLFCGIVQGQRGPVVHTVTVGGTPGWQITLLMAGAAVLAAVAAVLFERIRTARRTQLTEGAH